MSFSISLLGRSSLPHNEAVRQAFEAAVRSLRQALIDDPFSSVAGSGYSVDPTGSVAFTADQVRDRRAADRPGSPA